MNIALKFYSCVGSNHTTLDAIRLMQYRHPFGADDVEHITVHGSQVTVDHVGWPYTPQWLTSAQLNLPYCVATLLLEGDVFVAQFSEEMMVEPARGSEHRFASVQDVVDKFHKLAAESFSDGRAEQLRDRMLNLEKKADASQLATLLAFG